MPGGASYKYAKKLAFRGINPLADAAKLIAFGRDLYMESLGDDAAFRREFGRSGQRFPLWIASCAAAAPAFAVFLTENGREIGFVVLGADGRDRRVGHVHHFYIDPEHRGQGFGGLLDDYARETLRRAGFKRARLNVTARNRRAVLFYIGQGWTDVGPARLSLLRYMEVAL